MDPAAWMRAACDALAFLPLPDVAYDYQRRALMAVLLLAPLYAAAGVQVVNFRLSFLAEAMGHSSYVGFAAGVLLLPLLGGEEPAQAVQTVMMALAVAMALAITAYRRASPLSSDTVIGVFSSLAVAAGLFLFALLDNRRRVPAGIRLTELFQGSVLSVQPEDLAWLAGFLLAGLLLLGWGYNRMLLIGLNADLARTLNIRVALYDYLFAAFLGMMVVHSIRIVGLLLVTALLVVPAAAARLFAHSAGGVFWWGCLIAVTSGVGGLSLMAWADTTAGASIVLVAGAWFVAGSVKGLATSARG